MPNTILRRRVILGTENLLAGKAGRSLAVREARLHREGVLPEFAHGSPGSIPVEGAHPAHHGRRDRARGAANPDAGSGAIRRGRTGEYAEKWLEDASLARDVVGLAPTHQRTVRVR